MNPRHSGLWASALPTEGNSAGKGLNHMYVLFKWCCYDYDLDKCDCGVLVCKRILIDIGFTAIVYRVPLGEALDIYEILEKTGGSLVK